MDLALNHLRSQRAEVWRSELSVRFGSDDSGTPKREWTTTLISLSLRT
jgi:hypothetical protein